MIRYIMDCWLKQIRIRALEINILQNHFFVSLTSYEVCPTGCSFSCFARWYGEERDHLHSQSRKILSQCRRPFRHKMWTTSRPMKMDSIPYHSPMTMISLLLRYKLAIWNFVLITYEYNVLPCLYTISFTNYNDFSTFEVQTSNPKLHTNYVWVKCFTMPFQYQPRTVLINLVLCSYHLQEAVSTFMMYGLVKDYNSLSGYVYSQIYELSSAKCLCQIPVFVFQQQLLQYFCLFSIFREKTYVRYLVKEAAVKAWKGLKHKLKDFTFPLPRRKHTFWWQECQICIQGTFIFKHQKRYIDCNNPKLSLQNTRYRRSPKLYKNSTELPEIWAFYWMRK